MTLEMDLPESGRPKDEPQDESRDERPEGEAARERRPRRPWLFWPLAIITGLVAIAVLAPLTVGWRVWYQARQNETPKSDAIIVLGAAQFNGKPSDILRFRLEQAVKLHRRGVAPIIVTVGGKQPGDNFTEAEAGRNWLIRERAVPAGQVVAVPVGRDTLESMQAVGREYQRRKWSSGVIVTDPWHGLRSKKMAEDNGIKAAAAPTRSGPSVQTRDTQFNYIVRETGGYLSYVLLGHSVKAPTGGSAEPGGTPK